MSESAERGATLPEAAARLVDLIAGEPDRETRIAQALDTLKQAQRAAVHEAAIVLHMGGIPALYRLFAHYGIDAAPKTIP